MDVERSDPAVLEDPHAQLEKEFLAEYIRSHLPPETSLEGLSPAATRQLLAEASRYASARLAELETRARLVTEVHGAVQPGQLA
jgi:hypothetical protein